MITRQIEITYRLQYLRVSSISDTSFEFKIQFGPLKIYVCSVVTGIHHPGKLSWFNTFNLQSFPTVTLYQ